VWKHPNLRLAYVAQHAFHHVEQHLDMTPSQYIWWRYADGDDREALEKATVKLTDEEEAARSAAIAAGKRVVDYLNSRLVVVQWAGWVAVGWQRGRYWAMEVFLFKRVEHGVPGRQTVKSIRERQRNGGEGVYSVVLPPFFPPPTP
jgi:hypothetical protein